MLEKAMRLLAMALLFTIECASAQVLAAGWTLNAGQAIWSPERRYYLIMQGDGNLVFYRASDGKVRWHTNTGGLAPNATKLTMQSDGNAVAQYTPPPIPRVKGEVVLNKPTPTPVYTVWRSDTAGNPGAYMAPQDDGNLVVYASNGKALWNIGQDPETNKPNPRNLGDIVGRDLANVPVLGVAGHVGFYDGQIVYQVMNERLVVQRVSIENFKATVRPEQYWGYGSPAIPQYYVTGCFHGQFCADDNTLLNGGQLSDDERIAMVNIVARLHNRENTTGLNAQIEADMRALAVDSNKNIAHDAAMFYARFGYAEDTQAVLESALKSGAMPSESYFRELAHLVAEAPDQKKKEFIVQIRGAKSELATDILTSSLLSGEEFNAASYLRNSEDMAKLLSEMEPQFGTNVAQLGMGNAIRHTNWLRATALLESQKTGEPMDVIIVRRLSEPGTDPRKIMGYLSSPEARPMLASAGVDSPVQDLVRIAQGNANQHPASRDMRDVMSEIQLRMKEPPPVPPPAVFERPMPIGGPVPSQGG